jgi:hypothetical protein
MDVFVVDGGMKCLQVSGGVDPGEDVGLSR